MIEFSHGCVSVVITPRDRQIIDGWQGYGGHIYIDIAKHDEGVRINTVILNRGSEAAAIQWIECESEPRIESLLPGQELKFQLSLVKDRGKTITINDFVYSLIAQ